VERVGVRGETLGAKMEKKICFQGMHLELSKTVFNPSPLTPTLSTRERGKKEGLPI